jgi:signal transduction histidine kinase/HD-like signal output (HDOD) protein
MSEEAELHPLTSPAPAQPVIVMRLLELLGGETALPPDSAGVLRLDAALVLWVMTAAAQSARHRRLPTVEEALQGLSLQGLKSRILQEALDLLVRPKHASDTFQTWRQSLRCACLCETLALETSYPQPHEAYLAGLLHNLGPAPPVGWDLDQLMQERDAALAARVEAWRYPTLLSDALRYQHWPLQALRDAASIVQLAWAARSLVEQDGRASEAEIGQLLGIGTERLADLMHAAFERAESLLGAYLDDVSPSPHPYGLSLQLHKGLTRFTLLEQLRSSLLEQTDGAQGVSLLARHLQEVHGLASPIHLTPDAGRLVARPLPGMTPPPALSVPLEGSDTAAAMAFQWNRPITAITINQAGASLLDTQLARLAGLEGVLAIPIGGETPEGVLLTCGHRGQIVNLGEDQDYLGKLGRMAGRHRREAPGVHGGELWERQGLLWQLRARQLAHEINNPLGIVKNYLALLRVKLEGDAGIADELRVIHEELDRIARIVHALVAERPEALESGAETDVNAMLADLAKVAAAGPMQQKGVRIEQRLEPGLPPLRRPPDRLRQLLLNLLLNAMEAAPEGGVVSLETHRIVNHRLERQLEILISNTGPAIAPEVLARLFEPVHSTKGETHAGLGLSIVRALATDLDASVSCRSQPGLTTFQVLVPVDEG